MVERYGYQWGFKDNISGGGEDADGNPIAETFVWGLFRCDVQSAAGRFIAGPNGDNIALTYSLFTSINPKFNLGDQIRSDKGEIFTVLQIHDYKINYEIWV